MSEEYILKNLKIKSLSKIKLNTIDDFVKKHSQKLKQLDPSIKDWNKHIKHLRNKAIKKNKEKPAKEPKKTKTKTKLIEPTTPKGKPSFLKGDDTSGDDTRDKSIDISLQSLREQIITKLKIKEWTSYSDFLSFYKSLKDEYKDLTEDKLDDIPRIHREIIKLYTHQIK